MNDNNCWLGVAYCLVLVAILFTIEALQVEIGEVRMTWPDLECRYVEPAEYDCDNLPDQFDIVWVSPEWRP